MSTWQRYIGNILRERANDADDVYAELRRVRTQQRRIIAKADMLQEELHRLIETEKQLNELLRSGG